MSQDDAPVPPDLLARNPLITPRAARLLHDLKELRRKAAAEAASKVARE